jgi:hypothetical protein
MRQPVSACISAISRPLHGLSLPATDLRAVTLTGVKQ